MGVFVDTNVFIYALDEADPAKRTAASEWRAALWHGGRGRTSYQVLQEFYFVASRKWPSKREQARSEVRDLLEWGPVVVDVVVIASAWQIQDRYQLSFWDALIVAAAKATSCRYLLTEDLQHGQTLDGVQVISPFLSSPETVLKS